MHHKRVDGQLKTRQVDKDGHTIKLHYVLPGKMRRCEHAEDANLSVRILERILPHVIKK
jgi:hypothetical protein